MVSKTVDGSLAGSKGKSEKIFTLGGSHSRNSSVGSLMGDESSVQLLQTSAKDLQSQLSKEADAGGCGEASRRNCSVSGSCMCKLSVVFYLAACILVSALYVAFFGKNEVSFGQDAWIPGKVRPLPLICTPLSAYCAPPYSQRSMISRPLPPISTSKTHRTLSGYPSAGRTKTSPLPTGPPYRRR